MATTPTLRAGITALGLTYVAGILPTTTVWAPGTAPLPPKRWSGRGRPPNAAAPRRASISRSRSRSLRSACPSAPGARSTGAKARPSRSPRALRACAFAPRIATTSSPSRAPEEWLLIEWPEGRGGADQILALDACPKTSLSIAWSIIAKLRWRIERDYQELKQEVGLGHFEGRGWRGFHHHATLCIAAYGFLISERETIPPSGPRSTRLFEELAVPDGYRPRGSAAADRAPHPKFDRHHAPTPDHRSGQNAVAMPVLSKTNASSFAAEKFVTQ